MKTKRYPRAGRMPRTCLSLRSAASFFSGCVMALALANHRRWETEGCGQMMRLDCGGRRRVGRPFGRERVLVG